MAEGKAFDYQNPKKDVTNPADPQGLTAGAPYPKHLYRHVALDADGTPQKADSVIVAWDRKTPIHNEVMAVDNAADEADAVAKGFSPAPVLKAAPSVVKAAQK